MRRRASVWLLVMPILVGLHCGISEADVDIARPLVGSKATFDDSTTGVKVIECWAFAGLWCQPESVSWTSEDIPGTYEWWYPCDCQSTVTLTLMSLPPSNSDFGDTWVRATGTAGSDTHHFKLFFARDAANIPGGTLPNWYYYWSQTSAAYGTHNYNSNIQGPGYTQPVDGEWRSYIGALANRSAASGTWNHAEGIDYFANVCRHEERHRQDMYSLWGPPTNYDPANDPDHDALPTNNGAVTENSLGAPFHTGGYDPNVNASVPDDLSYGQGFSDVEDYCLHRQTPWTNGSADSVDWACPGHQY